MTTADAASGSISIHTASLSTVAMAANMATITKRQG
jgi:hypothetical protein